MGTAVCVICWLARPNTGPNCCDSSETGRPWILEELHLVMSETHQIPMKELWVLCYTCLDLFNSLSQSFCFQCCENWLDCSMFEVLHSPSFLLPLLCFRRKKEFRNTKHLLDCDSSLFKSWYSLKESIKDLDLAAVNIEEWRVQANLRSYEVSFTWTKDECYPWRWIVMCFLEEEKEEMRGGWKDQKELI